ncbi:MAG: HipA family kinase, partial [Ktedonobacteraceae bacterium]
HHNASDFLSRSRSPFTPIKDHVLLPVASALDEADALMSKALSPENIQQTINLIPGNWLNSDPFFADRDAHREAYLAYFVDRLAASRYFVEEAKNARAQLL